MARSLRTESLIGAMRAVLPLSAHSSVTLSGLPGLAEHACREDLTRVADRSGHG